MPRFFVKQEQITGDRVVLCGEDAHHIARSLRMAAGEHITVCGPDGTEYDCLLRRFDGDTQIDADILSRRPSAAEPPFRAVLYQALPKGDKLDEIIQKAVECGVCRIVPFESEHCVARVKPETEEKKRQRRCRIALEAAKQCGRGVIPEVGETCSFSDVLSQAADLAIFCYEDEDERSLRDILTEFAGVCAEKRKTGETDKMDKPDKPDMPVIALMVGSEGGFSPAEAEAARQAGWRAVSLGKRVLRTETAGIFALSCLVYALEL